MDFFFKPRGIAIIGASANPVKGGHFILKNILNGFKGGIYPVNPAYPEIEGIPCYPSVSEVPDPVDLAIIFVPAGGVPGIVTECAQRGIPGVMIESAGFAETGENGQHLQKRLVDIRNNTGIRIWGPNCMGLVDAVRNQVFSFVLPTIREEGLTPGAVSLVVQSGMLSAGFLIDIMTHATMGISKACSIGNKADVNECDLLEYLIGDPDTGAIGLYLESIPEGRRFVELCRGSEKPIVVLKGGKSRKGAQAALSHTASLAGDGKVVKGALSQVGVVEAHDFKQMMDLCRSLADYPERSPKSRTQVAVLTMSGAAGILSSDFMESLGLSAADLEAETVAALKQIFPKWMPVSNPVDLWPAVELHGRKKVYRTAFEAVCNDSHVDAVLFHIFVGGTASAANIGPLVEIARTAGKPLFGWVMGKRDEAHQFRLHANKMGVPVFPELYRAVECMAAVLLRKELPEPVATGTSPAEIMAADPEIQQLLADATGVLDEHRSKKILALLKIPVVDEKIAQSLSEAKAAAADLGFPVVLKGLLPGTIHKTELGLVHTGIASSGEFEKAAAELREKMPPGGTMLIQRHIHGFPELIAGLIRDPQFGPCVMCGFGGVLAEALADSIFAVAPLSRSEALAMIERLKAQKLLNGFRGFPPADRTALADVLVRLGELGYRYPKVQEIDINPLIVCAGKPIAVDATIILKA